jgi:hypothetical protein
VQVAVGHTEATFTLDAPDGVTEQIVVGAEKVTLVPNTPVTVRLSEVEPTSQTLAEASVTAN